MNRHSYISFLLADTIAVALLCSCPGGSGGNTYGKTSIPNSRWARALPGAPTELQRIAVDSSGNVYAVGSIGGRGVMDFGGGITVQGPNASENMLLVKYDADGTIQWARSAITAPGRSILCGVKVDGSGNVYVSGFMAGNGTTTLGNGTSLDTVDASGNWLLAKYDDSGAAQWAATVLSPPEHPTPTTCSWTKPDRSTRLANWTEPAPSTSATAR